MPNKTLFAVEHGMEPWLLIEATKARTHVVIVIAPQLLPKFCIAEKKNSLIMLL